MQNHLDICPQTMEYVLWTQSKAAIANRQVVMVIAVHFRTANSNTDSASEWAKGSVGRPRVRGHANMTERQRRVGDERRAAECHMRCMLHGHSARQRARYYPGSWMKHRRRCQEMKRLEALVMEVTSNAFSVHGFAT
jgi:hypothetical protein